MRHSIGAFEFSSVLSLLLMIGECFAFAPPEYFADLRTRPQPPRPGKGRHELSAKDALSRPSLLYPPLRGLRTRGTALSFVPSKTICYSHRSLRILPTLIAVF